MKVGQKLVAGLLLLAAALVGCSHLPSVGPDYAEPGITAPEAAAPDAGYPTTNKTATGEFRAAQTNEDPRAVITDASIRSRTSSRRPSRTTSPSSWRRNASCRRAGRSWGARPRSCPR